MMATQEAVLVTGGGGFLGRSLVKQLLRQTAWPIKVLALPHEAVPADWPDRVEVLRGDITRREDVERAAQGCGRIFHLAALVGDGGTHEQHERVTVGGTAQVFHVAWRQSARVGLPTSICAYGAAVQGEEEMAGLLLGDLAQVRRPAAWLVERLTRYFELSAQAELGQRAMSIRALSAEAGNDAETSALAPALLFQSDAADLGDRQAGQKLGSLPEAVAGGSSEFVALGLLRAVPLRVPARRRGCSSAPSAAGARRGPPPAEAGAPPKRYGFN